jgi:hypothetical protein
MECYEGATMIKTFRGLIAEGGQETIVLHTNDGSTGYRIVKFQVIGISENIVYESTVKIYKTEQSSVDALIDFSDNTLLAAALYGDSTGSTSFAEQTVIFDQEIFNQDIYVTHKSLGAASEGMNYYLELEQVKLDLNENTVATLKNIRAKVANLI